MKRGYVPPEMTISREELVARSKAFDEDIARVSALLSEASVRKYIEASDQRVDAELKDEVLIPEFDETETVVHDADLSEEERVMHDEMLARLRAVAGKTGAELALLHPKTEADYADDVAKARWHLARHWLAVINASHEDRTHKSGATCVHLRDDLIPEESDEEITSSGGSHMGYLRRDLTIGGICYDDLADACYSEFVANVKAYLAAHPDGLELNSHDGHRLVKDGERYIVRKC